MNKIYIKKYKIVGKKDCKFLWWEWKEDVLEPYFVEVTYLGERNYTEYDGTRDVARRTFLVKDKESCVFEVDSEDIFKF